VSGSCGPEPVERDSRGILSPALLRQRVRLTRYPAGAALDGLVDRFWAVCWDLPDGLVHSQQVLTHPCANLTIGNANAVPGQRRAGSVEARLNGVARQVTTRVLTGQGWTVAAMTRPGGLGAFVTGSAAEFTDCVVPLGDAVSVDEAALMAEVTNEPQEAARVSILAAALENAVQPAKVEAATQVTRVARIAETSRAIQQLDDLCAAAGIGPRTLQRMFLHYAGVSPTWVIRRYRLQEVAEAVRDGEPVSWAQVAASLGFADQAHLIRAFKSATGQTPAAYADSQRVPPGAS